MGAASLAMELPKLYNRYKVGKCQSIHMNERKTHIVQIIHIMQILHSINAIIAIIVARNLAIIAPSPTQWDEGSPLTPTPTPT
jgi:hypothetical protein